MTGLMQQVVVALLSLLLAGHPGPVAIGTLASGGPLATQNVTSYVSTGNGVDRVHLVVTDRSHDRVHFTPRGVRVETLTFTNTATITATHGYASATLTRIYTRTCVSRSYGPYHCTVRIRVTERDHETHKGPRPGTIKLLSFHTGSRSGLPGIGQSVYKVNSHGHFEILTGEPDGSVRVAVFLPGHYTRHGRYVRPHWHIFFLHPRR